jgi:sugar phosphate isomerase/epimerase
LLPAAEGAGVRLGIEPEPGNIVPDANHASDLLAELGHDASFIGIVLDPANLVTPATAFDQDTILRQAFDVLGNQTVCLHAKDVVDTGSYAAAGLGQLDYDLVFELHAALPMPVPVVIPHPAILAQLCFEVTGRGQWMTARSMPAQRVTAQPAPTPLSPTTGWNPTGATTGPSCSCTALAATWASSGG